MDEKEYFTGRTGNAAILAELFGKDYIVIVLTPGDNVLVLQDIPANASFIDALLDGPGLQEWTRVRAYDALDAASHSIQAHNQYYNKTNDVPNWKDTTEIVN